MATAATDKIRSHPPAVSPPPHPHHHPSTSYSQSAHQPMNKSAASTTTTTMPIKSTGGDTSYPITIAPAAKQALELRAKASGSSKGPATVAVTAPASAAGPSIHALQYSHVPTSLSSLSTGVFHCPSVSRPEWQLEFPAAPSTSSSSSSSSTAAHTYFSQVDLRRSPPIGTAASAASASGLPSNSNSHSSNSNNSRDAGTTDVALIWDEEKQGYVMHVVQQTHQLQYERGKSQLSEKAKRLLTLGKEEKPGETAPRIVEDEGTVATQPPPSKKRRSPSPPPSRSSTPQPASRERSPAKRRRTSILPQSDPAASITKAPVTGNEPISRCLNYRSKAEKQEGGKEEEEEEEEGQWPDQVVSKVGPATGEMQPSSSSTTAAISHWPPTTAAAAAAAASTASISPSTETKSTTPAISSSLSATSTLPSTSTSSPSGRVNSLEVERPFQQRRPSTATTLASTISSKKKLTSASSSESGSDSESEYESESDAESEGGDQPKTTLQARVPMSRAEEEEEEVEEEEEEEEEDEFADFARQLEEEMAKP